MTTWYTMLHDCLKTIMQHRVPGLPDFEHVNSRSGLGTWLGASFVPRLPDLFNTYEKSGGRGVGAGIQNHASDITNII